MTIDGVRALAERVRAGLARAVVGQDGAVELLTALLAGGHVLLEGRPGTARTFLVRCFARTIEARFGRIQFTPDLMPGDIFGSDVFDFRSGTFGLTPVPVFCGVLRPTRSAAPRRRPARPCSKPSARRRGALASRTPNGSTSDRGAGPAGDGT